MYAFATNMIASEDGAESYIKIREAKRAIHTNNGLFERYAGKRNDVIETLMQNDF